MSNVITDASVISEDEDLEFEALQATHQPTQEGMEFHVQMSSYTLRDFDGLVIDAAARILMGRSGDTRLAKAIEERCVTLTQEKIAQALEPVTAEILDQPMLPGGRGAKAGSEPVTMRQFVGLCGREFLQQRVDSDGKPAQASSWSRDSTMSMAQWMVSKLMDQKFRKEIDAATQEIIREFRALMLAEQKRMLEAERARIREALAKEVEAA